jgi:hypothetical protein
MTKIFFIALSLIMSAPLASASNRLTIFHNQTASEAAAKDKTVEALANAGCHSSNIACSLYGSARSRRYICSATSSNCVTSEVKGGNGGPRVCEHGFRVDPSNEQICVKQNNRGGSANREGAADASR